MGIKKAPLKWSFKNNNFKNYKSPQSGEIIELNKFILESWWGALFKNVIWNDHERILFDHKHTP